MSEMNLVPLSKYIMPQINGGCHQHFTKRSIIGDGYLVLVWNSMNTKAVVSMH